MKKYNFVLVITSLILVEMFFGFKEESKSNIESKNKVLIHLTTNIKKDDAPPCVAFDIALANAALGNKVEFLFDSEAAWNLKKSKDGKNDFDRYEVPNDLKKIVNDQLHDSSILKLRNFGEFLELLDKKGVNISVNGTWNLLTGVEKEVKGKTNIPNYVSPLTLKEFVNTVNDANVYYKY